MEIGYWKFDGAPILDYSRFGHDATTTTAIFDSPPILPGGEYSARFAGSQSVVIPHAETLDPMLNDFYIEFLIERQNDNFTVLSKGCYAVGYNAGLTFTAQSESGATHTWNSGVVLDADTEYLVDVSYRQEVGEVAFFVNGTQEALVSGTPIRTIASATALTIGTGFVGRLDALRIVLGIPIAREMLLRHQEIQSESDYEYFVNYKVPYSFTPMGDEVGDSTYQGRDLVWSVEPPSIAPIMFGLPGASYISTETATLASPSLPFTVTAWLRYQDGFSFFTYGTLVANASTGRIRANGLQSDLLVAGQLCFVGVVVESANTRLYVNGTEWTVATGPGAASPLSFFGGTATQVAGLEIAPSALAKVDMDRRFQMGFTGRTHIIPSPDPASTTIGEASKVLDFEWVNYSVKR